MTIRRTTVAQHFKDEILAELSTIGNVAQFVSFAPINLENRFSRVRGFEPNYMFGSTEAAVAALLERAPEGAVNIRSFTPDNPKSRAFHYGIHTLSTVMEHLRKLASDGLYCIVNETINVEDGGVSGVSYRRNKASN